MSVERGPRGEPSAQKAAAATGVCILLACFSGSKEASRVRHELDGRIRGSGDAILDTVIVRIAASHKVRLYDPRRRLAGVLTSALTWGLFGLVAGGLSSLAVWAVLGALCGGLYAYYTEHLLTKAAARRPPQNAPIHPRTAPFGHPRGPFRKPVLYPLSYEGIVPICRDFVPASVPARIQSC